MTLVKAIINKKFSISLYQNGNKYCVSWLVNRIENNSELINDYKTASFLFDMKLQELEGH